MTKPHRRIVSRGGLQADHEQAPTAGTGVPGPMLPRTIQLCIHCRQRSAGSWASHTTGQTTRRPWRLSRCQDLDQSRYHTIPFDGHTGVGR